MRALKRALLAIGASIAVAGLLMAPAMAQTGVVYSVPAARDFAGFEQLTLSDASAHALAAVPAKDGARPVRLAVVKVEGAAVRYRLDGSTTAPTASVGVPIADGGVETFTVSDTQLAKLRFIRQTASTVNIWVQYFY